MARPVAASIELLPVAIPIIIDRSVTTASRFHQLRAGARANPTRDGQTEQLCLAAKLLGGHSLRAGRDTVL